MYFRKLKYIFYKQYNAIRLILLYTLAKTTNTNMSSAQSYTELPEPVSVDESSNTLQTSLYIPTLSSDLMLNGKPFCTEVAIKDFFENLYLFGKVSRVDIATRPVSSGTHMKCAFVHFSRWSAYGERYREALLSEGKLQFHDAGFYNDDRTVQRHRFYSPSTGQYRYIVVKINRTPIPEIAPLAAEQMNVHQLVDNYKRLEKKLAELEAKLAEATTLAEDRVNHINALTEDLNVARDLNEHLFIENEKLEDDLEACRDFYEEHHDKGGFDRWLRIATHRCHCFEDICTCEIEEEDEDEEEYQEPDADDIAQMED
jgi:hypothetical protein